jgi:hypothetical protein
VAFIVQRSGDPLKWRHIRQNVEGNLVEIFFSHLPLCTRTTTGSGRYLRDSVIKSKQDGKKWL